MGGFGRQIQMTMEIKIYGLGLIWVDLEDKMDLIIFMPSATFRFNMGGFGSINSLKVDKHSFV